MYEPMTELYFCKYHLQFFIGTRLENEIIVLFSYWKGFLDWNVGYLMLRLRLRLRLMLLVVAGHDALDI